MYIAAGRGSRRPPQNSLLGFINSNNLGTRAEMVTSTAVASDQPGAEAEVERAALGRLPEEIRGTGVCVCVCVCGSSEPALQEGSGEAEE